MAGPEFFQTVMGHRYYDSTMPRIAAALETIAVELKRANDRTASADITPEGPKRGPEGESHGKK